MALAHFQETIGRVLADGDVFIGSGASVEVRDETNGALAAIFVDRDGVTPKSNPFNADSQGFADFYVASGRYRVKVSINGNVTLDLRDLEMVGPLESLPITTSTGTQTLGVALDDREAWVDDLAGLKALSLSGLVANQSARITTTVRAGSFTWVTGDQSANITADPSEGVWVAPSGDATGASGAWMRQYNGLAGFVSPDWFGASPDDSTDNSAPLQAAVDYFAAKGGARLLLSAGTYRVSTPVAIKSGVHVEGHGERATVIRSTTATDNIFNVGDGTSNPNDIAIGHMTFDSTVTKTGGYYIKVVNGHNIKISRIRMESPYHGIWFDGGNEQFLYYLDNFEINSPVSRGIVVGSDSLLPQDVWVRDGIIFGQQTGEGIFLRSGSGLYFSDIDVINTNKGVVTFPATGNRVGACFFTSVLADTCVDNGWDLIEDGGINVDITMQGCWGATCATGLRVGSANGVLIDGGRFINNDLDGISLTGGENINISDTQSFANSVLTSAANHGLSIAAGVSDWTVKGGAYGSGGLFGNTNQGYGILVNAGASDRYSIIGVDVTGNVTGGISDGGTGTEKYIYGNVGFRTSSSGAGSILSGQSSGTFPHSLGIAPAREDVQITATTSPSGSGISSWYVSAVDATNVTVTANTATTADWFFGFSVRVKGA